jgi:hypothetical protein
LMPSPMDKAELLKCIAEAGYSIGFGAKKNFATSEIAGKGPGWVGIASVFCGIFGLLYEPLSGKFASATLVFAGFCAFYMVSYKPADYEKAGEELTDAHIKLRNLYRSLKGGASVRIAHVELQTIQAAANASTITKQIFGADWFAHYKFFGQQQTDWMDEQLHFGFWKDKVPAGFKVMLVLLAIGALVAIIGLGIRAFI